MKAKVLHGRNEHGFVIGSYQEEQFERMVKAGNAREGRETRPERLREKLERPAWWDDEMTKDQRKNRRFAARSAARRAARKLGVDVPEWVTRHDTWGGRRRRLAAEEAEA